METEYISKMPGDDTEALQRLFDNASRGDTIIIPAETRVLIDAVRSLRMRPGTRLKVDGMMQAMPNDRDASAVVLIDHVDNVTITGRGQIIGERETHLGSSGPEHSHGMGVMMLNSSDITLRDITASVCLGDGFYVQDCRNVEIENVISYGNRRNALSIIAAENLRVTKSTFLMSNGPKPLPQCGIDLEPDTPEQQLLDIIITENRFMKNKGAGCYVAFEPGPTRRRVNIVNNDFDQHYKDGSGPPIGGKNTPLCNFFYATCRWMPGYDYWFFKREFNC